MDQTYFETRGRICSRIRPLLHAGRRGTAIGSICERMDFSSIPPPRPRPAIPAPKGLRSRSTSGLWIQTTRSALSPAFGMRLTNSPHGLLRAEGNCLFLEHLLRSKSREGMAMRRLYKCVRSGVAIARSMRSGNVERRVWVGDNAICSQSGPAALVQDFVYPESNL